MASYTKFFLLSIPKANLAAYRSMARKFAVIAKEHGTVAYGEYVQDVVDPKILKKLGASVSMKTGEVLVFSHMDYASKAACDKAMQGLMRDPRVEKLMGAKPLFDMKRMLHANFKEIVRMK